LHDKENTYNAYEIGKFVALGFWRQCPILLPLNETLKLFNVFNAYEVCVVIWCNCLDDLQKRNQMLEKFNAQKTKCEKITYIMNDLTAMNCKGLTKVIFSAFV